MDTADSSLGPLEVCSARIGLRRSKFQKNRDRRRQHILAYGAAHAKGASAVPGLPRSDAPCSPASAAMTSKILAEPGHCKADAVSAYLEDPWALCPRPPGRSSSPTVTSASVRSRSAPPALRQPGTPGVPMSSPASSSAARSQGRSESACEVQVNPLDHVYDMAGYLSGDGDWVSQNALVRLEEDEQVIAWEVCAEA